ncbi:MAG: hypothetical protein ACT6FF_06990 [Methanosarcinaceae archaeon]
MSLGYVVGGVWVGSWYDAIIAIRSGGIAARVEVPGAGAVITNASEVRVRYLPGCVRDAGAVKRTRKRDRGLCVSVGF